MSTPLQVLHDSETTVLIARTERFGTENTHTEHTIHGIALCREEEVADVYAAGEIAPGYVYYLVYIITSTGDSFSRNSAQSIDFILVCDTEQEAETLVKDLRKQTGLDNYPRTDPQYIYVRISDTHSMQLSNPGYGFFENIDEISYKKVRL